MMVGGCDCEEGDEEVTRMGPLRGERWIGIPLGKEV